MGVPKFFRWLSERYPKINQRYGSLPLRETTERYFDKPPPPPMEYPDPLSMCGLPPEIDRLYLDMNGIIHCCSHNNEVEDDETTTGGGSGSASESGTRTKPTGPPISREEIFRNVCFYLDRIIGDIVQPNELVYMAIDGVAPRAKLNQQRSRRYRSGLEGQIETTIYEAHAKKLAKEQEQRLAEERKLLMVGRTDPTDASPFSMDDGFSFIFQGNSAVESSSRSSSDDSIDRFSEDGSLQEVSPGRFKGKFEATTTASSDKDGQHPSPLSQMDEEGDFLFHSNVITPGTPFMAELTRHLEEFVKFKISTDPKWQKLTIIFSGPNVPGEGEHKIMDFIRAEKKRPNYNQNLRHCILGQDGDLIMLGLATHEPNLVLLRERVVFNMTKKRLATAHFAGLSNEVRSENDPSKGSDSGLDSYLFNAHFEFLHMGVLRDYLAFEFETSNVLSTSPYDLEHTIDDFVFMTFFVGNDFLPHIPALDIADHAFDLLFQTYKQCREKWRQEDDENGNSSHSMPYLTHAGDILSGKRLEEFLTAVGSHEVPYYDKKRQVAPTEQKRIERVYKKFGMESNVPDASLVASKEESDRAAYRQMLVQEQMQLTESNVIESARQQSQSTSEEEFTETTEGAQAEENVASNGSFSPVMTGSFQPSQEGKEQDDGFFSRMGNLLQNSLSGTKDKHLADSSRTEWGSVGMDDQDLKGRYYYDKFQFSPFDEEKHLALRKAYIEGLVWNLKYYYAGCPSWEWYFPYHYGPMLSDLVNLDEILEGICFKGRQGAPLKPFEQLMGCMPPSQAHHLPKPYRKLMLDSDSPIIDFYPKSFTIDMNGKRWPWEAVTLLPFIDSQRLLAASSSVDDTVLSDEERERNSFGEAVVISHLSHHQEAARQIYSVKDNDHVYGCSAKAVPLSGTSFDFNLDEGMVLQPRLVEGVEYPLAGFGSLRDAPVQSLWRRKLGVDIFSSRSRYKTACLEMSNIIPPLPPIEDLASKLIGTSIFMNYPYFLEGFVTAVSDESCTVRGDDEPRKWQEPEAISWRNRRDGLVRQFLTGEGVTGSGGLILPDEQSITISVRPFEKIVRTKDGVGVKSYAKFEVEVPLISTLWSPSHTDPRLELPSKLEKNLYHVARLGGHIFSSPGHVIGRRRLFPPKKQPPVQIQTASFTNAAFGWGDTMGNGNFLASLKSDQGRSFVESNRYSYETGAYQILRTRVGKEQLKGTHRPRISARGGFVVSVGVLVGSFMLGLSQALPQIRDYGSLFCEQRLMQRCDEGDVQSHWAIESLRGGGFEEFSDSSSPPPLEFAHGTTTLSFIYEGGIIAAVDSRASLGSFVGSKTTQKVLPVNSCMLGTMAGGAADCQFWIRHLKSKALLHELVEGSRMTVARGSRILSNALYEYQGRDLSIGTMIMGFDEKGPPRIFYLDNTGKRIEGGLFAVGSGSTFALGILDTEFRHDMSDDEAIALGIKAIRHATFRDAYSGGFINVYHITRKGWKKVYTGDIARR